MLDTESTTTLEVRRCAFQEVPKHLHAMSVMGREGDSKHIWDKSKPAEVEAARVLFQSLRKQNYLAFRVTDEKGTKGEQMHEFDPNAERMLFTPQMQAG